MTRLNVGIIGAGVIGDGHADAMSELDDQIVVAIADPVEAARNAVAARHGIARTYSDWRELVGDGDIDVVYIGTPNHLHMPMAVAAMEAGKHVVCEKPLARTVAEARAMISASRRTGKSLFVALSHRFMAQNQRVKQMMVGGEIGRPFLARSTFIGNEFHRMDDPTSWKGTAEMSGGGVVIDNGTHMIDLLRWWLGDAMVVTSRCGRLAVSAENKEEDTASVTIEFADGVMAELSLTFGARFSAWPKGYGGAAIRTEIYGLDGALMVGNESPALRYIVREGELRGFDPSELETGMPGSLQTHFADCIRGDARPIVTAEDGLAALEIVEAAYESAKCGRPVPIGAF